MSSESKRVRFLNTMDVSLKEWLEEEKKRSGRSISWIIEHAVRQYRDRLERGRKLQE